MSEIVQNDTRLCGEKLERFHIVSRFMIPGCFGGFDPQSFVCNNHCGRAKTSDIVNRALEIRKKLNVLPSDTFFGDEFGSKSCQHERLQMEIRLVEARQELDKTGTAEEKKRLEDEIKMFERHLAHVDALRIWNIKARLYKENKLPDDPALVALAKELTIESKEKLTVIIESKHKA